MKNSLSSKNALYPCLQRLSLPLYHWKRLSVWMPGARFHQCRQIHRRIRKALRQYRRATAASPRTPQCLDDYAISNYFHRVGSVSEQNLVEDHLATCDWCLARTWAIFKGKITWYHRLTVPDEVAAYQLSTFFHTVPEPRLFVRWVGIFILIITVFFLLLAVQKYKSLRNHSETARPTFRGEFPASIEMPTSTLAIDRHHIRFHWKPVKDAQFYQITIWEAASGKTVVQRQTEKPRIEIPLGNFFSRNTRYLWKVEAFAYQRLLYEYPSMSFVLNDH